MKLWSGTLSPFSAKVRIALAEKGLQAEIVEIPWSRASLWGPKPQAFLDVSPRGEVPVLEDQGLAIVDSTVINEYLEDAYPVVPLMPADPQGRAACRMWEDRADYFMATHISTLIAEVFMKPNGEGRDEGAVADAMAAFSGYLDGLDARLVGEDHLCGEYSLADIATWLCLTFGQTLGVDLGDRSGLQAWYVRISERPAVQAELALVMGAASAA
jgi:glutathione S-transferase